MTTVRDQIGEARSASNSASGQGPRARDDSGARCKPESGRYHLYVARNCPWAHGIVLTRRLAGDRLTLADLRAFPTLIRFDECYHTAFKCNKRYVHQYDHPWPNLRDVFQTPGVAETVVWDHIRDRGYYQGEITPVGRDLDFGAPHDRDRLAPAATLTRGAE